MEPAKYPVRGWLQGLIEGSATLGEVEEVIIGFIKDAKDKSWQEGFESTIELAEDE